MATGVQPRDEESQISRAELETIQDAMKSKKFREMLSEYCQEITDPANQALYQQEMTQLEKERGYDVTFINPKGGYVIKTSVAGDRKAFINICSNENVGKPSYDIQMVNGQRGMNWQVPYSLIPPREDYDHKKVRVVIYDVVFHPDTLRMAEVNKRFRKLVNKTAFDGLNKAYDIHLDVNNSRFPKSNYKGMITPAVIRKEDPNYAPPTEEEVDMTPEMIEKLYPQHIYSEKSSKAFDESNVEPEQNQKFKKFKKEYSLSSDDGYTLPKYVVKQQKNIDFQDFTYHKDCKQHTAIPSQILVEIYLPLLSSTKNCILDVKERSLYLKSEKPAKYKLFVNFPYSVNDECGSAKFDKSKHMLIVTLPVIRKTYSSENKNASKVDSGVESEENSQSDDENKKDNLVVELTSSAQENPPNNAAKILKPDDGKYILEPNLGYILPPHTHNVMDDTVAFTFHVKNTVPDSVKVNHDDNEIKIKFTSVGSGFVPIHYAAVLKFDNNIKFSSASGEAWDNNVILQLEVDGELPKQYQIGLNDENMTCQYMDVSQVNKNKVEPEKNFDRNLDVTQPMVEVTNLGNQTEIMVTTNNTNEYEDDDNELPMSLNEKEPVWIRTEMGCDETRAKSILRKSMKMSRNYSESSAGDIASSMDYVSSDCIPEESSFKKSVRFNDVIAKQFYRYNSSIEGQKRKNQRKKNKKRNQERHKSESEAEDDGIMIANSNLKSVLKPRRDSGLADTSDAECEFKMEIDDDVIVNTFDGLSINLTTTHSIVENVSEMNRFSKYIEAARKSKNNNKIDVDENVTNTILNITDTIDKDKPIIWKSDADDSEMLKEPGRKNDEPKATKNIKHNTDLYNPDKLNKGQYLEVSFKNDLIFDLDM